MESNVAISVFLWKHNLEINSLINRHAREVLSNIGKPHSNIYKTYNAKHGKGVTVPLSLLKILTAWVPQGLNHLIICNALTKITCAGDK